MTFTIKCQKCGNVQGSGYISQIRDPQTGEYTDREELHLSVVVEPTPPILREKESKPVD